MRENNFTVKDATTVFMLPFSFDKEYHDYIKSPTSIWEISSLSIDEFAFYPHIHDFLVENIRKTGEESSENPNSCFIYSLKDKRDKMTEESKSILKLFGKHEFEIKTKSNESNKEKLSFRLLNDKSKLSSPKLVLYPMSSVGLLLFSTELTEKNRTLEDLITLNYRLHKINSDPPAIQITLPSNAHEQRVKEAEKIYQLLAEFDVSDEEKNIPQSWHIPQLFRFLLFNFENDNKFKVKLFNNSRFHLFTYLLVDSLEKFEIEPHPKKDELMIDFIRLARCQNKKYEVLSDNKTYIQTFENIYVASCVEGACMMVDSRKSNLDFFNEFKNATFLSRYLWMYLLIFLQRQTLIELTKKLMNIDMNVPMDSKNNLTKHLSILAKMKINSYFTDISDHTQHNTFYRFCSDNLLIKKYLDEAKEKIESANFILQEQIEKREKERSLKLNIILALVAILQIYFGIVSFYNMGVNWLLHGVHIVFGIFVLYILYFVIDEWVRTKNWKN